MKVIRIQDFEAGLVSLKNLELGRNSMSSMRLSKATSKTEDWIKLPYKLSVDRVIALFLFKIILSSILFTGVLNV